MEDENRKRLKPGYLCKLTSNMAVFIGYDDDDAIFIPVANNPRRYVVLEIGFILNNGTRMRKYIKTLSEYHLDIIRVLPSEPVEIIGKIDHDARISILAYHLIYDPNNRSHIVRTKKTERIDTIDYLEMKNNTMVPSYRSPWFTLSDENGKRAAEPGNVYQFEKDSELAVLVHCGQGTVFWLPIYTLPIDREHIHERRSEIAVHLVPKNDNYISVTCWTVFDKERMRKTTTAVSVRHYGKIAIDGMSHIRRMLTTKHIQKAKSDAHDVQLDSQEITRASISIETPIINVQEAYELIRKYPQFEHTFTAIGKCPFKASYFVFRDQSDQLVVLSIDKSGNVEGMSCQTDISTSNFVQLVFGFLNSKNTTCEPYDAARRDGPKPKGSSSPQEMLNYKILHINPIAARKNSIPTNESIESPQPARLVRGHFTTYTEGKPLFGKPWGVGTFWIGPHVSGNAEFGIVMKDYHIDLEEFLESLGRIANN